jgi:hypothetical protein
VGRDFSWEECPWRRNLPYLNDRDSGARGLCDAARSATRARCQLARCSPTTGVVDRANRAIEKLRRVSGGAAPRP